MVHFKSPGMIFVDPEYSAECSSMNRRGLDDVGGPCGARRCRIESRRGQTWNNLDSLSLNTASQMRRCEQTLVFFFGKFEGVKTRCGTGIASSWLRNVQLTGYVYIKSHRYIK